MMRFAVTPPLHRRYITVTASVPDAMRLASAADVRDARPAGEPQRRPRLHLRRRALLWLLWLLQLLRRLRLLRLLLRLGGARVAPLQLGTLGLSRVVEIPLRRGSGGTDVTDVTDVTDQVGRGVGSEGYGELGSALGSEG